MSTSAPAKVRTIRAFESRVSRIEDLSPSMRRITLESPEFSDFGGDLDGRTLDLRIKAMIPNAGKKLPDFNALFDQGGEGHSWYQLWLQMDASERGYMRTYTARTVRRDIGELDIDFVLHSGESLESGPAGYWAQNAQLGDALIILGPSLAAGECQGIEFKPGASTNMLLVGDETALPAIAAILEELDPATTGSVLLEVPTPEDFLDLAAPENMAITWLARHGETHGTQLIPAVRHAFGENAGEGGNAVEPQEIREVNVDEEILWETPEYFGGQPTEGLYAWIAGEAAMVRELRRYLVRELGVDRKQVAFMGYWRYGKAERD